MSMRTRVAALALTALAVLAVACASGDARDDAAAVVATAAPAVEASDVGSDAEAPDPADAAAAAASDETLERTIAQATSDAAPPDIVPELPGRRVGLFALRVRARGRRAESPRSWRGPAGEQVRVPISYAQLKALAASGAEPPDELQMTREELTLLVSQLDGVRSATEKYADISVALAEGYRQTTGEVPKMGAHFNHYGRIADGVFNPAEPEILMYSRDEDGQWELVATSYVLPRQTFGDDHPEGFAGPLDNWHVHYALCLGASGTRTVQAAECRANAEPGCGRLNLDRQVEGNGPVVADVHLATLRLELGHQPLALALERRNAPVLSVDGAEAERRVWHLNHSLGRVSDLGVAARVAHQLPYRGRRRRDLDRTHYPGSHVSLRSARRRLFE